MGWVGRGVEWGKTGGVRCGLDGGEEGMAYQYHIGGWGGGVEVGEGWVRQWKGGAVEFLERVTTC